MTRNRTSATGAARPRRPRLNRRQVMLDLRWAMLSLYAAAFSAIMYYERVRDVTLDTSLRIGAISATSLRACQFSMGFISGGLTEQEALDLFNWFETYRIAVGVV